MISIIGPTASGKTDLAYALAQVLPVELITADSKHVYRHMNIGTGKDLPSDAVFQASPIPHYELPSHNTKIWLMDVVNPDQDWSVAQFVKTGREVIELIQSEGKIPVLVGGTGFYLQQILEPQASIFVPQDHKLRTKLETYSVPEIQKLLQQKKQAVFEGMNNSDKNNRTRLIRALEIAIHEDSSITNTQTSKSPSTLFPPLRSLQIGLSLPLEGIEQRIAGRVLKRFEQGIIHEVESLMALYPDWTTQAFTATGYQEVRDYLEQKQNFEQTVQLWKTREFQYAKRQLTWFNNQPDVRWVSPVDNTFQELAQMVQNWYDTSQYETRDKS